VAATLVAVPALTLGAAASATVTSTTTPTTMPATTTTVVDTLAGIGWIQATYPSPCSDATVQLVGGSAMQGDRRAVLDDVVALDQDAGTAVAFLSCRASSGATVETSAVLLRARPPAIETIAERQLGPGARIVAVDVPRFTVEVRAVAPATGALGSTTRHTLTALAGGLTIAPEVKPPRPGQPAVAAAIGRNGELVRRSVRPIDLCYPWNDVWLSYDGEPTEPVVLTEPAAELLTLRLALILVTNRWIEPTDRMNADMAAVVTAYQEARGLTVDGAIGRETTGALRDDLGCPDADGFTMVLPTGLGPRRYRSVAALVAATARFAAAGASGDASTDQLLSDAHWDGSNAMFLGCYRRESPPTGVTCSWSGTTPLQLIGLVDDPAASGLGSFSILYARSAAA
jgi:hypothetical protein